ncbi:MAG: dienelactone hydrolase family protein, partial [Planctomycetota bacterium]|nr:dienelactone hydrolase family protein [Planctomycetota bacterium]
KMWKVALFSASILLTISVSSMAEAAPYSFQRREQKLKNPSSRWFRLKTVIWYPTAKDSKALAKKPKNGFPVLVFLHGFGGLADTYRDLSQGLAKQGYIVVQNNSARFSSWQQRKDGRALYNALKAANKSKKSFWHGAFNMKKIALGGHSMGAGSATAILAKNPGYKAGFCFAPVAKFENAGKVTVPMGLVMGEGDKYDWKNGERLFRQLPKKLEKFFYLLNSEADHQNLVRRRTQGQANQEVWSFSFKLCLAFLDKHLKDQDKVLETLLNEPKESRRTKIYRESPKKAPAQ